METLVHELNEICTEFPLKEKIIIVDSFQIGEQLVEGFLKRGYNAINLKYKTVHEFAVELVEMHSEQLISLLNPTLGVHLTHTILRQLKEDNILTYFHNIEITPSFSHAIYTTIKRLRLANFSHHTLPVKDFLTLAKGEDMKEILRGYEEMLSTHQLLDEADLLIRAQQYVERKTDAVYILQSDLHLSHLEEELLSRVLPESVFKLPLAPVYGIKIPERKSISSISWGNASTLSYLYDIKNVKGQPNLGFFSAKSEEIEAKHVLEQIKMTNKKLDENVIYYSDSEPYVTLFYHLSQKWDIPITFGEGLPISFSRPGRFIGGLIKWIQSNYSGRSFLELLHEGLLQLDEGSPSHKTITAVLRDLQVGWGQERYVLQIEKEMERLTVKKSSMTSGAEKLEKHLNHLAWLNKWFKGIFKKLPRYEDLMNYQSCLTGIAYLVEQHCKTNSALDEVAKTSLLEEIDKVLPYSNGDLSSYEVFEKLKDLLLNIRVNHSKPRAGHLHITTYKAGVYNTRPNAFVVGLDNRRFPGGSSEDPLLLDAERTRLGHNLPIKQESGQENLYTMLQVLAHVTGKVTVSYCNFNINDNRAVSPAHLFLQCYRFVTGNKDAEFKELTTLPSTLVANEILEDKDYWFDKLLDEEDEQLDHDFFEHFYNVKYGLEGEWNRSTNEFTPYDGLITVDRSLDPCINPEKTVTAGKLETLAKCPYSYFLQEVLRVRPVEDIAFDPYKWLDAATRGRLLHSIFETFYKELKEEGDVKPNFDLHEDKIVSIGMKLIEKEREALPPPNERVFNREIQDILECCRIFLKEEESHCVHYDPLYFEYSFGIGDIPPAEITLPSGATVRVSGKIDRVDRSTSGDFHILDYKTGSTYGYGTNQTFKGGRQLQHLIYALAIEQHLQLKVGTVQESAYYFPTVKGLAQRFVRKQDESVRAKGADLLERLIEIIKHGTFTMTDDINDCKFCEFKNACRRSFYDPDILEAKQMDKNFKELKGFMEVRSYE